MSKYARFSSKMIDPFVPPFIVIALTTCTSHNFDAVSMQATNHQSPFPSTDSAHVNKAFVGPGRGA
jgi:hypothetical protein